MPTIFDPNLELVMREVLENLEELTDATAWDRSHEGWRILSCDPEVLPAEPEDYRRAS